MIISDLSYLEVASEGSSITGGKLDIDLDIDKAQDQDVDLDLDPKKLQTNVGILTQVANAVALGVTLNGKAIAKAKAGNSSN